MMKKEIVGIFMLSQPNMFESDEEYDWMIDTAIMFRDKLQELKI